MKTRTLVLVFLIMAVLIIFGSCATGQKAHVDKKMSIEDIYGTWISNTARFAKVILYDDGTWELYEKATDTEPIYTAKMTITDSWYDQEGNLWVKMIIVGKTGDTVHIAYDLDKFHKSGIVWESVWAENDYPDDLSTTAGKYNILYRQ